MLVDSPADRVIVDAVRPEVRWPSAGRAWHDGEGRHAKDLVALDQQLLPGDQVCKEPVERPVQSMCRWNCSTSLLYRRDLVNHFAEDLIEGGDRIVRTHAFVKLAPRLRTRLASTVSLRHSRQALSRQRCWIGRTSYQRPNASQLPLIMVGVLRRSHGLIQYFQKVG